ncbi:hypothetical protein HY745_02365, partial [Candidatus Desantisbacteria bacterium]|nr:hypothetical protein [Candidatus Desantisbacteria bacterium]
GDFVQIRNAKIKIKVIQFIPDFYVLDVENPISKSKDLNNPAALIEIDEEGKEKLKIWIFTNYPDLYLKTGDKFSFQLISFTKI